MPRGTATRNDGKSRIKNDTAENVEKSRLESVENVDENGIISYNEKQQDLFDIDSLPEQMHHFATNKNKKYTPLFSEIVSRYELDLDDDWNMVKIKHRGKHPYIYHNYILFKIKKCVSGVSPDPSEWQFDHILPKSKGGTNSYSNCQIVSRKYNRKKWDSEE